MYSKTFLDSYVWNHLLLELWLRNFRTPNQRVLMSSPKANFFTCTSIQQRRHCNYFSCVNGRFDFWNSFVKNFRSFYPHNPDVILSHLADYKASLKTRLILATACAICISKCNENIWKKHLWNRSDGFQQTSFSGDHNPFKGA